MNRWTTAALLAALLLAPACQGSKTRATTPMNTVEKEDPDATPRKEWIDKIHISEILGEKVNVTSAYVADRGGLPLVQLNVQNDSGRSIHVRYHFEWFDEDGILIETSATAWNNITLHKGQRLSLKSIATSPRAVDWRFSVQESAL